MTQRIFSIDAPLAEVRAASTAAGGSALTSTASLISLPLGASWVSLTPRNFAGAVVAKWLINPWLTIISTSTLLLQQGTDLSSEAQDGDATAITTGISGLPTLANGGAIYMGSWLPFRGVAVDMQTLNDVVSALTCEYWNGGAWVALSETDGTETGANTTFGVDGNVTWTVPSAWATSSLQSNSAVAASAAVFRQWTEQGAYITPLYWTRWTVAAALKSTTSVNQLRPLNRSTAYAELLSGQTFSEALAPVGSAQGLSCVEALTDAGTANLIINVATQLANELPSF